MVIARELPNAENKDGIQKLDTQPATAVSVSSRK